uniref:Uncharacterized protein n=1 Tax=Heterosigma akashiwo TaxID=2829 RepID=A0A7S3YMH2_HETAK
MELTPTVGADEKRRPSQKNKKGKQCEHDGCVKSRHFGFKSEGYMRFCGVHKEPGMANLSRKTCEYEGCTQAASHGCPIKRTKKLCAAHKKDGMINLVLRLCLHPGCNKTANYKGNGSGRKNYCTKHKNDDEARPSQDDSTKDNISAHISNEKQPPQHPKVAQSKDPVTIEKQYFEKQFASQQKRSLATMKHQTTFSPAEEDRYQPLKKVKQETDNLECKDYPHKDSCSADYNISSHGQGHDWRSLWGKIQVES